jgi:hypothetical protein
VSAVAFGLPKPAEIRGMFTEGMAELKAELGQIRDVLEQILAELRTQRGG